MKLLICGERRAGKSTIIARLSDLYGIRHGFLTEKHTVNGIPAVIFRILGSPDHIVLAVNKEGVMTPSKAAFDQAAELVLTLPHDVPIIMDELGFLELCSPKFCSAVIEIMHEPSRTVIAAIKSERNQFLDAVCSVSDAVIVNISELGRNAALDLAIDMLANLF